MEFNARRMTVDETTIKELEKSFSQCRTCNHIRMAHTFVKRKRTTCLEATLTGKDQYERCTCVLFIPKDNLEFLEWAAENKEKKG